MRTVPARHGGFWLAQGILLFRKNPAMWVLIVFTYWTMIAVINLIPVAGPLLGTLFLPAFSVSFMVMCRVLEAGGALRPALLYSGFQQQLPTLVTLGGLYLVSIALVLLVSALADGGALASWVMFGTPPKADAIRNGSLSTALLIAAAGGMPVVMAFWFAPVLVAWEGLGAGKAMFFSFFASWRNWRAFLVYAALLAMAGGVLSVLLVSAAVVLHSHPGVLRLGMIAGILVTMPVLFGSFYAAYCDIFPPRPDAGEAPPEST